MSNERREEVLAHLRAELEGEPTVRFAYLYGSVLDSDTVHDVDVGLYLEESALARGTEMTQTLFGRLTTKVGIPVDVRVLNDAPLLFHYHVLRGQLLVCRDETFLTGMIEDVARRYLDLAPLLRQSTTDAFAA